MLLKWWVFSLIRQKTLWEKEKMLVTLLVFSPFPTVFSKAFFFRVVKSQDCVVQLMISLSQFIKLNIVFLRWMIHPICFPVGTFVPASHPHAQARNIIYPSPQPRETEMLAGAWSCSQCTYKNYPGRTVCEMCGYITSPSASKFDRAPLGWLSG